MRNKKDNNTNETIGITSIIIFIILAAIGVYCLHAYHNSRGVTSPAVPVESPAPPIEKTS